MHQYDVWIDLECTIESSVQVVCALYAKQTFPIRPMVGEPLTFWSRQGSSEMFSVVTPTGASAVHYLATEVDSVAHHVHPSDSGTTTSTNVRCVPVRVATLEDARAVVHFMARQHGFELDPYGVNLLSSSAA